MVQAARCPKCRTSFRIVPDQLKISEGWVRCGHCAFVFNAFETQYEIHEQDLEQLLQRQGVGTSPDTLVPEQTTNLPLTSQFQNTRPSVFSASHIASETPKVLAMETTKAKDAVHDLKESASSRSAFGQKSAVSGKNTASDIFNDSLLSELHISWADTQTEGVSPPTNSTIASKISEWMVSMGLDDELAPTSTSDTPSKNQISFPDSRPWDENNDNYTRSSLPPQARLPGLSNPSQKDIEEINFPDSFSSTGQPSLPSSTRFKHNRSTFEQTTSADSLFSSSQVSRNSQFPTSETKAPSPKQHSTFMNTALKPLAPSFSSASNKSTFAETKVKRTADPDDFSLTNLADNDDDDLTQNLPEFSDSIPLILAVSDGFSPQKTKDTVPPNSIELDEALYPQPQKKKLVSKRPSVFEASTSFAPSQFKAQEKTYAKKPSTTRTPPQGANHTSGIKPSARTQPSVTTQSKPQRTGAAKTASVQPISSTEHLLSSDTGSSRQFGETNSPLLSQIPASKMGAIYIDTEFPNSTSTSQLAQQGKPPGKTQPDTSTYASPPHPYRDEGRLKEAADPPMEDLSFIRQVDQDRLWDSPAFTLASALLCTVLSLILVAQSVFIFRDQIALGYPSLKPSLSSICAALNCTISYPRNTNAIAIYDSKFQDTGNGSHYQFYLFMRNQSTQPVSVPSIELTLKDNFEQILARKVFTPQDLHISQAALQPGEELLIDKYLLIDASDIRGFNVELFYP